MNQDQSRQLGHLLQTRRKECGLSTHKLAAATGMDQATVVRFEAGSIGAPRPDKLARIADVLGVGTADVFALAGYTAPTDLPALRPYLTAKYPGLLTEDIDRIEAYTTRIAKKRGFALVDAVVNGLAPGSSR